MAAWLRGCVAAWLRALVSEGLIGNDSKAPLPQFLSATSSKYLIDLIEPFLLGTSRRCNPPPLFGAISEAMAVTDVTLAPLADAKYEAIEQRFMATHTETDGVVDAGASADGNGDLSEEAPRLPAALLTVRDTATKNIVGFCTVVGCVKVRDAKGSRLLSGREAETYIMDAQASAKVRVCVFMCARVRACVCV